MAANFVRMCSITGICTHTQRIYGTWKCISHQNTMEMIKITIDTDNILADQPAPYQKHNNHTFATRPATVQPHFVPMFYRRWAH